MTHICHLFCVHRKCVAEDHQHWILCIVVYRKQKNHSYHNVNVHTYVHCISNATTVLAYSLWYRLEKVNPSEKEIKSCQLSRHDID